MSEYFDDGNIKNNPYWYIFYYNFNGINGPNVLQIGVRHGTYFLCFQRRSDKKMDQYFTHFIPPSHSSVFQLVMEGPASILSTLSPSFHPPPVMEKL